MCYKEVFFIPCLHFQANWLEFMIVKLVLGAVRRLVRPRFTVLIFGCPERPNHENLLQMSCQKAGRLKVSTR